MNDTKIWYVNSDVGKLLIDEEVVGQIQDTPRQKII